MTHRLGLRGRARSAALLLTASFLAVATVAAMGTGASASTHHPARPQAPVQAGHQKPAAPNHPTHTDARNTGTFGRYAAQKRFGQALSMPKQPQMPRLSHIKHHYVVTTKKDPVGDTGVCPSANNCTLRAAIREANSHAGVDLITFRRAYTIVLNATDNTLSPTTDMFIRGLVGTHRTTVTGSTCGCELFDPDGGATTSQASVEISGMVLRNGAVDGNGGAVWVGYASVSLHNDVIAHNTATDDGGGVYTEESSSNLWLTSSKVQANSATYGGGVYLERGQVVISKSWIGGTGVKFGNSASSDGGGLNNNDAEVAIYDTHIDWNNSGSGGGGYYQDGYTSTMIGGTLSHNTVTADGPYGGGIVIYEPTLLRGVGIVGNVLADNGCCGEGGGIYTDDYTSLVNVTVRGNLVKELNDGENGYGGGIYNDDQLQVNGGSVNGNVVRPGGPATYLNFGEGGGIVDFGDGMQLVGTSVSNNKFLQYNSGCTAPCSSGYYYVEGGGIYSDEHFTLNNLSVNNNTLLATFEAYGGGIEADYGQGTQYSHIRVSGNTATSRWYTEGGGIDDYTEYGTPINDSVLNGNTAIATNGGVYGGALYSEYGAQLHNVVISNTTSTARNPGGSPYVYGGAVYTSNDEYPSQFNHVRIVNTTNNARAPRGYVYGGAIFSEEYQNLRNVSVDRTTNIAGTASDNGYVYGGGYYNDYDETVARVLSITNTKNTVRGDGGYVYGGAFYSDYEIVLTRAVFGNTRNTLPGDDTYVYGGGVYADDYLAANKLVVINTNDSLGGAGSYVYGGGLYVNDESNIDQSTVANTLAQATGTSSYIYGGGVYVDDNSEVSNATFVNNVASAPNNTTADDGAFGGAWYADDRTTFTNVTMNHNSATRAGGSGGGAVFNDGYVVTWKNSVVWGSSRPACKTNTGSFYSAGYNDGPKSCGLTGGGDFFKNPQLGPLVTSAGMPVELPAPTSPLIDRANDAGCPSRDERGVARPKGRHCDIGAVEGHS